MNANDLLQSLSGIDPKYIDEAAYELHGKETPKVIAYDRKRRFRKYVAIALPSAAAALLFIGIAMSGVLSSSKSDSAGAVAEAPSAAAESAMSETTESMGEAAEDMSDAAVTESMDEAAMAEEPAYEEAAEVAPAPEGTINAEAAAEPAYEEAMHKEPWVLKEADYDRGILIIRCGGTIPENLEDLTYRLTKLNVPAAEAKVSGGKLSALSDRIEVEDNWIVMNLTGNEPERGSYRLTIGDLSVDFEVE